MWVLRNCVIFLSSNDRDYHLILPQNLGPGRVVLRDEQPALLATLRSLVGTSVSCHTHTCLYLKPNGFKAYQFLLACTLGPRAFTHWYEGLLCDLLHSSPLDTLTIVIFPHLLPFLTSQDPLLFWACSLNIKSALLSTSILCPGKSTATYGMVDRRQGEMQVCLCVFQWAGGNALFLQGKTEEIYESTF